MSTSIERHAWIEAALAAFRVHFKECGYDVPEKVRISMGFSRGGHQALGQCINKVSSKDDHFELFVSPIVGKNGNDETDRKATINILETVAHEIIHAIKPEAGHQGEFITVARAVGFKFPWKYTPSDAKMLLAIDKIINQIGLFPAGAVVVKVKKQGKALVKCVCEECDFTAYVTRRNLEETGTPVCPTDFIAMECE